MKYNDIYLYKLVVINIYINKYSIKLFKVIRLKREKILLNKYY